MIPDTSTKTPEPIYLSDYRVPAYLVEQVDLTFVLEENHTRVKSRLEIKRNPVSQQQSPRLMLNGRKLQLEQVQLDGAELAPTEYQVDAESLVIDGVPNQFVLEINTLIDPANNTSLEGLYLSSGNFCTQCEAQGFRKITYYPDRPDVMARFKVRLEADQMKFPVLLSNGNPVGGGTLEGGRHFAEWEDPFPKPSYLFALVAGNLVCLEDSYTTASGKEIQLQIYVEERNREYCDHAMLSLQKSMAWDEQVFGLEYDLDRYMIVAVDDFNMGAMENKGLNVFNSKYVLAHPDTATDNDYLGVEGVIGHEYFHNWTGNRVTCRDWFQLSLKEGLTVFRDQQFSADMNSEAVKRIDDVRILRQHQFPEDGGPMAHPVRPASYVEINNFYTMTIYNKGAEVIRMMRTLLGEEKFIAGVQSYLRRHDGRAVTCDDFVKAMADAGQIDLAQFRNWYSQAGTPEVSMQKSFDPREQTLTLNFSQSCPATPQQPDKEPFHIPVAIGLLGKNGEDLPLQLEGELQPGAKTRVLELTENRETYIFTGLTEEPIVSPLRGFSAPVRLKCEYQDAELAFRMAHDSDSFNRWEAGQILAIKELQRMLAEYAEGRPCALSPGFVAAWRLALDDQEADLNLLTQLLTLPSEQYLAEQLPEVDPQAVRDVRNRARLQLAIECQDRLQGRYHDLACSGEYSLSPAAVGRRSLRNLCLVLLMLLEDVHMKNLCLQQYRQADNMTDRLAAFAALLDSQAEERSAVIDSFYEEWQDHPLVVDKWFSMQALSHREDVCAEVEELLQHHAFTLANPNRVRSLLGAFSQNMGGFHRADGAGYRLLGEQILLLDQRNPQVAARMTGVLSRWRRLEPKRRELMKQQLEKLARGQLSRDLFEIVSKSLS